MFTVSSIRSWLTYAWSFFRADVRALCVLPLSPTGDGLRGPALILTSRTIESYMRIMSSSRWRFLETSRMMTRMMIIKATMIGHTIAATSQPLLRVHFPWTFA